ncbi:hypothetical protein SMICM17S_05264 [Streptomyces microflavus]
MRKQSGKRGCPVGTGGNREDLREGTASAVRLLAAGHGPRVHADRRRPVRGRGGAADARGGSGALALGVLVQSGAAPQVPARLGAGAGGGPAGGRAAGPRVRRPGLVERRHRRHRAPGLAAGAAGLAGVRPQGARLRAEQRGHHRADRYGAGQRRGEALARGRGRGRLGAPARPGPDGGALHPAAVLRAALGRGRPPRRGAQRRAGHRRRPLVPGLRRDRAVGALPGADLGGAAGGGHRGGPGRAGEAGLGRRVRRRGLVLLRTAALPGLFGEPDGERRGRRGAPGPARPQRAGPPGTAGPPHGGRR